MLLLYYRKHVQGTGVVGEHFLDCERRYFPIQKSPVNQLHNEAKYVRLQS